VIDFDHNPSAAALDRFSSSGDDVLMLDRVAKVLAALDELALNGEFFGKQSIPSSGGPFPRYRFEGPTGGGDRVRIAFFAGIHGDEPAGTEALIALVRALVQTPNLAQGYELFFYPICNLHGFQRGSRFSATGKDLNREFWKDSNEWEVRVLEEEIRRHSFHGLVSLHADDTSDGLYGFVRGAVLTRGLLEPALRAAEKHLPRNLNATIDGFPAADGIVSTCYDGILTSPPLLENHPFEIILETPQLAPMPKQVSSMVDACLSILEEYQKFLAFGADL
jgi:protein MpaA